LIITFSSSIEALKFPNSSLLAFFVLNASSFKSVAELASETESF